jgi:acetyl-CoA/propionyl-CoA carboxylase biotin carboxyl carrier protein
MLSKVIAWGRTAPLPWTPWMRRSLYTVLGIDTNVEYLRLLINDDDVRAGRLDTGLIDRKMPDLKFRHVGDPELVAAALYAVAIGEARYPGPVRRSLAAP